MLSRLAGQQLCAASSATGRLGRAAASPLLGRATPSAHAVGAIAEAVRCTSSTADGPRSGSGARRTPQHRAPRSRTWVRKRSSLLDFLADLREADLETQRQEGTAPSLPPDTDARWQLSGDSDSSGPVSLLSTYVDESRAFVDPDLYEIEVFTDKLGRQLFRVVQIGSADEFDGFEDSPLDEPFLPFGVPY